MQGQVLAITIKEIRRLYNLLAAKLKRALPHIETRTIGDPHGNVQEEIRFLSETGDDVFFSSTCLFKNKRTAGSLFGHGKPGSNAPLNMDIQFNFPVAHFSRALGGAFLRHSPTNNVVLAHRGIVTRGHGRIPLTDQLGIQLLTFTRSAQGRITICGLKQLK